MSSWPVQMLRTIRRFAFATAGKPAVPALLAAVVVVLLPAAAAGVPSNSIIRKVLSTKNETITFTLAMSLQGNQLRFDVLNGNSLTWHKFGGSGYLRATASTNLNHLGTYSSKTSTQHSRVSFAPHCVKKLVGKQVRYYTTDGLLTEDSTECIVYSHNVGS